MERGIGPFRKEFDKPTTGQDTETACSKAGACRPCRSSRLRILTSAVAEGITVSRGSTKFTLRVDSLLRLSALHPAPRLSPRGFPALPRLRRRQVGLRGLWQKHTLLSLFLSRAFLRREAEQKSFSLFRLLNLLCGISELLFHPWLLPSSPPHAACSRQLCRPFCIPDPFEQEVSRFSGTVFSKFVIA